MEEPGLWGELVEAVRNEPDQAVAASVVLRMLERVPVGDRPLWVRSLSSPEKRSFAQSRADDLTVLEEAMAGRVPELGGCSRWLQERLFERVSSAVLLRQLADEGATRRIRGTAAARLRGLRTVERE